MRRPRRRLEVSTFPFLAVLLCAMGSLILLLLVLDRRAKAVGRARALEAARVVQEQHDAAARAVAEEAERRASERAAERERRRRALHEQLAHAQDELTGQLNSVTGRASEIARAATAQRDRWRELLQVLGSQREELAKSERDTAADRGAAAEVQQTSEAARKETARLSAELRGLELVLAELKEARKRDAQTYSLLPYRGKRGDSRRPLYVECTADGLIFHPDRKRLPQIATPAEVRDEVESRARRQREAVLAQGGKPDARAYLLMLVRPDGIASYYGTIAALQGREVDFGYEFIDADWVLDFPEGDVAPASQPWMATRPVPVAPSDPSAPKRKVTGLHTSRPPGEEDEIGEGDRVGTRTGTGSTPAPGGSSDLPPLPGLPGGGAGYAGSPRAVASAPGGIAGGVTASGPGLPPLPGVSGGNYPGGTPPNASPGWVAQAGGPGGSSRGNPPGLAATTVESGTAGPQGGTRAGPPGRASLPDPDGRMPGSAPLPSPGAAGQGSAGGPAGTTGTAGGGGNTGPPALFPTDRATSSGGRAGGQTSGTTGTGHQQPGDGTKPGAERGGTPGSGAVSNATPGAGAEPGGTPGAGAGPGASPGSGAEPGAPPGAGPTPGTPAVAGGGGSRGGVPQPQDPDDPQGPHLSAGLIPGGGRPPSAQAPRTMRLIGNRDWVIPIECRADGVVLRSVGQKFPLTSLTGPESPLLQAVRQAVARRQASVRPGEPPYRPQARFLIYPDGLRTYYLAFPALQTLGIPLTRQNVDADPTGRPAP